MDSVILCKFAEKSNLTGNICGHITIVGTSLEDISKQIDKMKHPGATLSLVKKADLVDLISKQKKVLILHDDTLPF